METAIGKWWDEKLTEFIDGIKNGLREIINDNLENAFDIFNDKVSDFTNSLTETPESFNSSIYNLIKGVSENVMLPLGVVILAFIFVIELYDILKEVNNSMGSSTALNNKLIEVIGKTMLFILVIVNAWTITMKIFEIGADTVSKLSGQTANLNFNIDISAAVNAMDSIPKLIGCMVTSWIVGQGMKIVNIALMLCMYIRMFEIYIYISVSPVTYGTLPNKDWGEIGKNYIRSLIALSLQAFFMLLMVAIYGAILAGLNITGDLNTALWECLGYCVLLIFMLFKAGGLSKSIFNAH